MVKVKSSPFYYVVFWETSNRDKYKVRFCESEEDMKNFCAECNENGSFYMVCKESRQMDGRTNEFVILRKGIYPTIQRTLLLIAISVLSIFGYALYYLFTHV